MAVSLWYGTVCVIILNKIWRCKRVRPCFQTWGGGGSARRGWAERSGRSRRPGGPCRQGGRARTVDSVAVGESRGVISDVTGRRGASAGPGRGQRSEPQRIYLGVSGRTLELIIAHYSMCVVENMGNKSKVTCWWKYSYLSGSLFGLKSPFGRDTSVL